MAQESNRDEGHQDAAADGADPGQGATADATAEAVAEAADAGADATADTAVDGDENAEPETPAAQIERLQRDLAAAQEAATAAEDRALRAAAEAENTRRRAERNIENAHKFALEKFVGDLLPAVDSFERAADAASGASAEGKAVQAIAEGVELSLKLLIEALERQGIAQVDPIGAPFDPALHEAMTMVERPDAEPNSVVEVFQKGYTVNGRLARPARVIVAKAPATPAPEATAEADASDADGAESKA